MLKTTALAGFAVIAVVATARAEDGPDRGRQIAEAACSPCHAIGKSGSSPNPRATPFREISTKYPVRELEEALGEGILVGHPEMPQVRMSPSDIDAFLDYLETVQVKR